MDKEMKTAQAEKNKVDGDGPIFKDPKEYADLPKEVRQKMSENMMAKLKGWASKSGLGG